MIAFAAVVLAATFTRPMERVSTVDPAMARSVYDAHAVGLLYASPLAVDYRARPYRLVPGYCELPRISEDGLTYDFHTILGPADDMVRSLRRLQDPAVVSPNAWMMRDVAAIEVLSGRDVRIRLSRRCHYFSWLMAMPQTGIVGSKGAATGDFTLTSWRRNHEMIFTRRHRNESAKAVFDRVRYLVIDDASTQWLMFLRGEVDCLATISRDNWESVVTPEGTLNPELAKEGLRLCSAPTLEVIHIGMNMKDPVLGGNRKLRQALNAAFDYPAWERFSNGRIVPCQTPVPPGVAGRIETPFAYAFDLSAAKRLLSEAGYPNGIDPKTGRRLTLSLLIGRPSQESREAGELMASFYEKIGIRLELDYMTWDAFVKAVNDGRFQMFRMGWVGDYPDAQNFLQLFYSKCVSPGPNHTGYANDAFDRAYEAALASPTEKERNRYWLKCQEIVREDCPWIFTHCNKAYSLTRPNVGNYTLSDFPYGNEKYYEDTLH